MKLLITFAVLFVASVSYSQVPLKKTEINRPTIRPGTQITAVTPPAPDPMLVASYNWWKTINPTNANDLSRFTKVNPSNYDTGLVAYSKRTALSLVGWINKNINITNYITGDSLVHLIPLVNLEQLEVSSSITENGLSYVSNLKNLKEFRVALSGTMNTYITDKALGYLGQLPNLQIVALYSCPYVTDNGLKALTQLTNLKELSLLYSAVTDAGLGYLKSFPNLEILNLARTSGITDAGVDSLIDAIKTMKNFKRLTISFTNVTAAGRQKLSDAGISFVY